MRDQIQYSVPKAIHDPAKLSQLKWYLIIFGLDALIFLLDNLSSSNIPFFEYYIFPIALSSWLLSRKVSYLLIGFQVVQGNMFLVMLSRKYAHDNCNKFISNICRLFSCGFLG